jgi:hypothetical protein
MGKSMSPSEYALTSLLQSQDNRETLVALEVDDVLVTGPAKVEIQRVKDTLNQRFHMTDLGPCSYHLGMTVNRDRQNRIIRQGQEAYDKRFLKQYSIQNCSRYLLL